VQICVVLNLVTVKCKFVSLLRVNLRVFSLTEFGVHLSGPVDDPRRFGELRGKIEEWGFDSVWLADGLTRSMPEPFPLLACASTFTERIKLGTCVYVLPLRHESRRCNRRQGLLEDRLGELTFDFSYVSPLFL